MRHSILALVAFCMTLSWSHTADAKKGLLFLNWGEDAFEAADLPPEIQQEMPEWKFGYKCSIIGIFWAYFHTWDCQPVAFKDDGINSFTYDDSPEVQAIMADMGISEADIKMGVWTKHGRWLFLAVLLLIGYASLTGSNDDEEFDVSDDPDQEYS